MRTTTCWRSGRRACAEHVLPCFESVQPDDPRPRQAIEHARAWVNGAVTMMQARAAGGHAMGAARDLGAARHAAYAAGQAGAVAHVAAHELGAAAYAIKAARAAAHCWREASPQGSSNASGSATSSQMAIRELVLDDQRPRNHICWSVFAS
ncbi:MAG: putative immunity protein [Nocardioidaceae bacterium]